MTIYATGDAITKRLDNIDDANDQIVVFARARIKEDRDLILGRLRGRKIDSKLARKYMRCTDSNEALLAWLTTDAGTSPDAWVSATVGLRMLAERWQDHPDYQEAWRP